MVSHARSRTLLFLGGNGHRPARLSPARSYLEALGDAAALDITEALYPGFDGRPTPSSLDAFLSGISWGPVVPHLTYATGIGGLIALCLRARGRLPGPLLMQAPILWGLERRVFPKVMRAPGVARAVGLLLATPILQRRFFRKHFRARHSLAVRGAFAAGYRGPLERTSLETDFP